MRVVLLALVLAAGCDGPPLACYGPQDCHGNACCFDEPISSGDPTVYCTRSPDACPPKQGVELSHTRICQTDADCTAGGISTYAPVCCPSSVLSRAANTCQGRCLPR